MKYEIDEHLVEELFQIHLEEYHQEFSGWDFSYISNRMVSDPLPWSYDAIVRRYLPQAESLLDLGTGGGEFLAKLPYPKDTFATENYTPNILVAEERLNPLGIEVLSFSNNEVPLPDNRFSLIINRHEEYLASEIARLLTPNGLFITQQVGSNDFLELNMMLEASNPEYYDVQFGPEHLQEELENVGLVIKHVNSAEIKTRIYDIGALLYYLKAIPWQIPNFRPDDYISSLFDIHQKMLRVGYIEVTSSRFIIIAQKL